MEHGSASTVVYKCTSCVINKVIIPELFTFDKYLNIVRNKSIVYSCIHTDHSQQSSKYSLIPEKKTWFEAQLYCRNNHTDLVSIRNETENEQVKEAVNGKNAFWIGLQYNNSLAWFDGGHSDYEHQNMSSNGCLTSITNMDSNWSKLNVGDCNALCYSKFRQYFMLQHFHVYHTK